ncbi:MAG: ornithine decarboxylase [Renibacterium sp.]|nr:ornithine decarboxylase [Renibacterium sp.]
MTSSINAGTGSGAYFGMSRARIDVWGDIADTARRLAAPGLGAGARAEVSERLAASIAQATRYARYYSFPDQSTLGRITELLESASYLELVRLVSSIGHRLADDRCTLASVEDLDAGPVIELRPRFDLLVVTDAPHVEQETLLSAMLAEQRAEDEFVYGIVMVPSLEDALVAVLVNPDIQAVVVRPEFQSSSTADPELVRSLVPAVDADRFDALATEDRLIEIADRLRRSRPELDLYLVERTSVEELALLVGDRYKAVFLQQEDILDLHLSILHGIADRYRTPFFTALTEYSRQPTGVFHAMPISRGNSVVNSKWIREMAEFYGLNIFLAETSSTAGGLDSLLDPRGPIKEAQELAARAFGAQRSYFVTNGTSTANKIVTQALVAPDDVVLVDRNAHKSHHYAQVLAGSNVAYLNSYSLDEYSMYGAISLPDIKRALLAYRREGRLDEVRMIALTNCTFDGIVYDVERVMTECLAIKPDLVFLWDEAWFAFARCHPVFRQRTAMAAAERLAARFQSPQYRAEYARHRAELDAANDADLLTMNLLPDPDRVRLRVYATQSTHKTLTSLRQGSMIHIFDEDFANRSQRAFYEAYMTHTSTSPNYQILASLDIGRRQVELEGFELVQRQVELAMKVRNAVASHPLLSKYFRVLGSDDLIPAQFRASSGCPLAESPAAMDAAWQREEFVLDPSRITIGIGATGIDGDTFRTSYLMDGAGIQVNKTTRNSILAMTNIGTTRSAVSCLLRALLGIATDLEQAAALADPIEQDAQAARVEALTQAPPPLPDFSRFHAAFRARPNGETADGNLRKAFFLAYENVNCEFLTAAEVRARLQSGGSVVSAGFVTPYPPGFPVLVPGQEFNTAILDFMQALDTKEIHGLDPVRGYRVFTGAALEAK